MNYSEVCPVCKLKVNWDLTKEQREEALRLLNEGISTTDVHKKLKLEAPTGWNTIRHIDGCRS